MNSKFRKYLRASSLLNLNHLQWVIPLFLAFTALLFEFIEHQYENSVTITPSFIFESVVYGIIGPIIAGILIAWMRRLVIAKSLVIAEMQALNRDLEKKVAERTALLAERNQQLNRLDEMKSEFVSLVSHELRAPLTALNGGLEVALQSPETLPPASRHILETMADESSRLTQFVQTILDVSRLEAGRLMLNLGPVAVTPILYRSVEVVLGEHRQIHWHIPQMIPPIWADEIHFEQVIRNLLRNADKYSPKELPIEIRVLVETDHLVVEVADHGLGIPPEAQERIFEQFHRGQTGESALPGWGLGLYFAKKLTEAQGGQLTVQSPIWPDEPRGSAFAVRIPLASDEPDETENV